MRFGKSASGRGRTVPSQKMSWQQNTNGCGGKESGLCVRNASGKAGSQEDIERLQSEVKRLRDIIRDYVDITKSCMQDIERLSLTDKERKAIKVAASDYGDNDMDAGCWHLAATLRGLLERTQTFKKIDSLCEAPNINEK